MAPRSTRNRASAWRWIPLATALLVAAGAAQAQRAAANPFEGLTGSWSGTGSITLGSGDKERIRCRVSYAVNERGDRVEQELRCASDSYKFELNADIVYENGYITGRWDEKTRRKSGSISGRAMSGRIEALAETSGFSAFLTLITRGNQQVVSIRSQSPDISDVSITLRRGAK